MDSSDDPVGQLRRWEDSGAVWRVIARTGSEVVIALLTCTAGEEVGRLRSSDPDLMRFVGSRITSEQQT